MKYNFICQFNHLCVGNIHVYATKYRLTTSLCTSSNKFNSSALSVVTTTRRCYIRQQLGDDFVVSHNPKDPALTLGVFFISSKHWSTTSCAQTATQKWCCKSSKTLGNLYKKFTEFAKNLQLKNEVGQFVFPTAAFNDHWRLGGHCIAKTCENTSTQSLRTNKQTQRKWNNLRKLGQKHDLKKKKNGNTNMEWVHPPPSDSSPAGFLVRDQELNLHWHPGVGVDPRQNQDPLRILTPQKLLCWGPKHPC